jgi:hypothetical protein
LLHPEQTKIDGAFSYNPQREEEEAAAAAAAVARAGVLQMIYFGYWGMERRGAGVSSRALIV